MSHTATTLTPGWTRVALRRYDPRLPVPMNPVPTGSSALRLGAMAAEASKKSRLFMTSPIPETQIRLGR